MTAVAQPISAAVGNRNDFARGVYRIADPKITLASVASMLLGAAAAARDGRMSWPWLALTVAGIFFLEAAKNASGELYDFDSGDDLAVADEDRSPFSGGKRVLVDGLLTRRQTAAVAFAFYALGGAAGLAITIFREPRVLPLGLVGAALAFFYHAPPLKLSYRGLGELTVAICYGPLISCGTYLVQRGNVSSSMALLSIPLGILTGSFLFINEFPDSAADESAGKRTLVVRLGRERASSVHALIVAAGWISLSLLPVLGAPPLVLLGAIGLPHSIAGARRLLRFPTSTREIIPAQAATLASSVLLALGMSIGLIASH